MALSFSDDKKIVPDAFHGTDFDSAERIASNNEFEPSIGEDHYLGDGVYFFESSLWHAKDWAKRKAKVKGFPSIGVVRATVSLGRCLDLNNHEYRKYVRTVANRLHTMGVSPITEGVVVNLIANQNKIDTIRGNYVVPEKGRIFDGGRFFDYSCLMICVRNTACISGATIVYTGLMI